MRFDRRRIVAQQRRAPRRAPARPATDPSPDRRNAASPAPDWRAPRNSPGPRISRSRRAISKPSVVSRIVIRRCLRDRPTAALIQQQAHAGRGAAPDAAAQLVQLRQAEALRMFDHHQRRIRHVDADLDHRRRDQHMHFAARERIHHRLLFRRLHAGRAPGRRAGRAALRPASRGSRSRSAAAALPIPRSADRPSTPAARPARPHARVRSLRRAGSGRRARVTIGVRPGGSSSITDTSRSA